MTTLSFRDLVLRTPDGRTLLDESSQSLPPGITALVGANGAGKSTLLRTLAGESPPAAGRLLRHGRIRLVAPPSPAALAAHLAELPGSLHGASGETRRSVAMLLPRGFDPARASPGEITRAWLACLVAGEADAWLLDEPSAHLDEAGRTWLRDWLGQCPVPVLLASHDRELLDLADRTWELAGGRLRCWAGGFDAYAEGTALARGRAERELQLARRERKALATKARQAHEDAQRRNARGLAEFRKGSQGGLLQGYLRGRAEYGRGARGRAAAARLETAAARVAQAREGLPPVPDFSLDLPALRVAGSQRLLVAERLGLHAGGRWLLRDWSWVLTGPRRLALVGPNGCGKSTLLRALAGRAPVAAGQVLAGPVERVLVDQGGVPATPDERVLDVFLRHQPMSEAQARERLAWFLFRGEQAVQAARSLSSGERVRLGLACQLGGARQPALLLLDEPDNHLDLASLRAVENALSQFRGGLLVASHDRRFLGAIGLEESLHCPWTLASAPAP